MYADEVVEECSRREGVCGESEGEEEGNENGCGRGGGVRSVLVPNTGELTSRNIFPNNNELLFFNSFHVFFQTFYVLTAISLYDDMVNYNEGMSTSLK